MIDVQVIAKALPNLTEQKGGNTNRRGRHDCPQVTIYNVEGPLFFGVAQNFQQTILTSIEHKPKVLLLRMGRVPFMDVTGESHLSSVVKDFSKHGTSTYFRS